MEFIYGFEYKEIRYGWSNKKLYRLPYFKNKRSYSFKEIPCYVFKSTRVYNVQRDKLTINRLETLTKKVNWVYEKINHPDVPF